MSAGDRLRHGPEEDATAVEGGERPLCADLDGTLIASDTLWESFVACARTRPLALLRIPGWLLRGRAALKRGLAEAAGLDPASLPYREEVVAYLREARAEGRPVVLATACDQAVADAVAAHLGVFSAVIASDGERNLKGVRKREALEAAFGAGASSTWAMRAST